MRYEPSVIASKLFAEGKEEEAYQVLDDAGYLIHDGDQNNG